MKGLWHWTSLGTNACKSQSHTNLMRIRKRGDGAIVFNVPYATQVFVKLKIMNPICNPWFFV